MVAHIFMLVPGVFLTLSALGAYRLLDSRTVMGLMLSGFLLPAVLQVVSFVRGGGDNGGNVLHWIFVCASVALVLLGLALFANGSLDRSPAGEVQATVLQKAVNQGRYGGKQYSLFVSSWRPGVAREDLSVSSRVFERAAIGKPIRVELHAGYFGLSWYERISAE